MPYIYNPISGQFDYYKEASGGGSGDVTGPASSTADSIVLFDGTTGKVIKDSGVSLSSLEAYSQVFNATTDWTLDGASYKITIPSATHNKPNPTVHVFEQSGPDFIEVTTGVKVDSSQNIIITVNSTPDLRFVGKLIIL